jgi:tetratricopeptide (TPR) repeat protein
MMGRAKEAISEAATACELDPMSPFTLTMSGFNSMMVAEFDSARTQTMRALELAPDFATAHGGLAILNAVEGKFEEAIREADEAVRFSDEMYTREWQAQVYAMVGLEEKAREMLDGLLSKKFPGCLSPTFIGATFYLLREKDRGWEWMQKAYEARDTVLVMHNANPTMKAARHDQRYLDLLKRLGLG